MHNACYPLLGQQLDGRYELRHGLGNGGFADVYRAWDNLDDVEVAIKVLKVPEHLSEAAAAAFIDKFREEAKLTRKQFAGMRHVRQVLNLGVAELGGAQPWMAMELLEGETLHDWLKRRHGSQKGMTQAEALQLVAPVFEVMSHAHDRGIVHRDLKPANLFLARQGNETVIKVLDFGIAKLLQGEDTPSGNTMTTSVLQMFSPQYGAPEQFAGKRTGKYTDVFALGLILTELLTDQAPLSESGDRTECMIAALDKRDRPTPRRRGAHVTDQLEAVLSRALALAEADRYPDARNMWEAIEGAISARSDPASAAPVERQQVPGPQTSVAEVVREFGAAQTPPSTPASTGVATARDVSEAQAREAGPTMVETKPGQKRAGAAPWIVVGLLGLVGMTGAAFGLSRRAEEAPSQAVAEAGAFEAQEDSGVVAAAAWEVRGLTLDADDASWGNADAPVIMVVFSDFGCPFCAKLGRAVEELRTAYGPDKLRIVLKHYPLEFHTTAKDAAIASQVAYALGGSQAFWDFHDRLFAHQKEQTRENFITWSVEVGLAGKGFTEALDDPRYASKVDRDMQQAVELGIKGVPQTLVNGYLLRGFSGVDVFKRAIDEQLAAVRQLVAQGTSQDKAILQMFETNLANRDTQ